MTEVWRLFIALELPPQLIARLGDIQSQLIRRAPPRTVRWVRPASIHLTLKFLGDSPVTQRDALQDALQQAARNHVPFHLTSSGLGCFPNSNHPRVVWVGVQEPTRALQSLRDSVERFISPLGYPTENRPFSPHLTLGRVSRNARQAEVRKLGELIADMTVGELHTWTVTEVSLMRSELKPDGAVYTALYHAPMGPDA